MKLDLQIFQCIIVTYTFQVTGLNGLSFHTITITYWRCQQIIVGNNIILEIIQRKFEQLSPGKNVSSNGPLSHVQSWHNELMLNIFHTNIK